MMIKYGETSSSHFPTFEGCDIGGTLLTNLPLFFLHGCASSISLLKQLGCEYVADPDDIR